MALPSNQKGNSPGQMLSNHAPADRLVWEGMRRANELNSVYAQLGGKDARYQRVVQSLPNPASSSEEIRWMVGRLWEAMDGFLTLENLAERVGSDSYTVLVAVRELVNRGVFADQSQNSIPL